MIRSRNSVKVSQDLPKKEKESIKVDDKEKWQISKKNPWNHDIIKFLRPPWRCPSFRGIIQILFLQDLWTIQIIHYQSWWLHGCLTIWKHFYKVLTGYSFWDRFCNFYTNLHELFCQFISWTNLVISGKFMDNCWISCQKIFTTIT